MVNGSIERNCLLQRLVNDASDIVWYSYPVQLVSSGELKHKIIHAYLLDLLFTEIQVNICEK